MKDNDTKRLSRLTAILTQLQTKRILTSTALAEKFGVTVRTIYRDIRTLEDAGVPIFVEEGKGYSLIEGYRIPPVMFTEGQANALILAEQLVLKNKDASFVKDFSEAIDKIKAVLQVIAKKTKATFLTEQNQIQGKHQQRKKIVIICLQFQVQLYKFHLNRCRN